MAGKRRSRSNTPKYSRSARVSTTLQEIIADELVRIDDERLTFVTVTGIDVDPELNRAIVFFDSLADEDGDAEILEAFADHRIRLQASIAKQIRAKKTPILDFRPDMVIRSAARIDDILKSDQARFEREATAPPEPPASADVRNPTRADGAAQAGDHARRRCRRQAGGGHEPRRRRHAEAAVRRAAGRPRRDARSRCDGRARRGGRKGHPAAPLRREDPQGIHRARSCSALQRRTLDSAGDDAVEVRHVDGDDRRCSASGRRSSRRRHRTGAAHGVGHSSRREAAARARSRGHRGRTCAPPGDDPRFRRGRTGPTPGSSPSRSSVQPGRTSARLPTTSDGCWVVAPTSAVCVAPTSVRSPSRRRVLRTSASCCQWQAPCAR